ncbi:phosphocholine-specific phospholipase C [Streptomyces sp. NPDC090032]|uniref:phosphocholine-specific phospholipase C n=1 Tax=Streptomyces sp. NPDC090032 TaxID=3365925 RepID=UPI00382FF075
MSELNRRRFLQLAGATTGFSALSQSIAHAAAIPAHRRHGSLRDVEHIVVLMQENRSFDHYFGALRGVRGFGDPRPFPQGNGKSVWHQSDGTKDVLPFRPDRDDLGMEFLEGMDHEWEGGHEAWNNGRWDQWVKAKGAGTMAHVTRKDIPFHYALADTFTVCDAYHCSFIGATDPNRYYMWSGYVGNDGTGGGPVLSNYEAGYSWTTYPERLEKAGVSWKIYQDVGDGLDADGTWGWIKDPQRGNFGDNSLLYFDNYRNAAPGDPLYDKARTGTDAAAGDGFFDILRSDVMSGNLPQISWIAAPEAFTEHPNWPANYGAWYISQVLDALTSDPEVWSKTALFVTYDENDGYFDHVVPPFPPHTPDHGLSDIDVTQDWFPGDDGHRAGPYGLGARVPMTVVSPWSTGGYVCSETFDHTSIIRFMERRFGVHEPNISPWRRAICGDLTSAFDFRLTSRHHAQLPQTDSYRPPNPDPYRTFTPLAPATASMPQQEPGTRPARPLPYAPRVDGTADADAGTFALTFSTGPQAGGCHLVISGNREDGPWSYTTTAGRALTDHWNTDQTGGRYDLSVYGPNGFLRTFRGSVSSGTPELTARHDAAHGGSLELTLTNPAHSPITVTVTDAYRDGSTTRLTVPARGRLRHRVPATRGHRWYDLTLHTPGDPHYLRRLAGHIETGEAGTSDPGTASS